MLRAVVIGSVLAAAWPAAAGDFRSSSSNPAFLGVMMGDSGGACVVGGVTPGSAAEAIALEAGDIIIGLDDTRIASCDHLTTQIVSHVSGDRVKLTIVRDGRELAFHPLLTSRAEVLQRRYVGAAVPDFPVTDYDDGHPFELSKRSGDTNVLAWFDAHRCDNCASLVERMAGKMRVTAVTYGDAKDLSGGHLATKLGVRFALFDNEKEFDRASMNEQDRIYFMVVDCRGVVRFVLPVVPDADDADAAIDEVLAAVEQADRARAHR